MLIHTERVYFVFNNKKLGFISLLWGSLHQADRLFGEIKNQLQAFIFFSPVKATAAVKNLLHAALKRFCTGFFFAQLSEL